MRICAGVIFNIVFSLKITKKVSLFWKCNTLAKACAFWEYLSVTKNYKHNSLFCLLVSDKENSHLFEMLLNFLRL